MLSLFRIIRCFSYPGNAIFTEPKDKRNLNDKMYDLSIPEGFLEEPNK